MLTSLKRVAAPYCDTEKAVGLGFPWRWLNSLLRARPHRSLRVRLVVIVLVIDCLAAALTSSVIIFKARTGTKLEIASAMQLAEVLVADTIRLLQDAPAPVLLQSIDLHFQSVRHVKLSVVDEDGRPVAASFSPSTQATKNTAAPGWFSTLIAPPIETKDFPIVVRHRKIGVVTIVSEPSDEIAEAWSYTSALVETAFCLNIAVLVSLFPLFGRVLAPLTRLVSGLRDFEDRNYAVRLPRPSLLELATITDHFNKAAEALSASHDANRVLNRKLLTAQDDERRRTALELHDEAGPCLFTLEANATSIARMTKDLPEEVRTCIHERALDVVSLVENIQGINRRVLDRLRPMALGQIPLKECLVKLLVEFDGGKDGPVIEHVIGNLSYTYGFLVDLTLYRCVQEGLFNALRHAHATRIRLALNELRDLQGLSIDLRIRDDGTGLNQPVREGIGLSGMRERVEALSGSFELRASPEGTTLAIRLPIDDGDSFAAVTAS